MDRDYFQWGATTEIMEVIRRKRQSPELVEPRLEMLCMPRNNKKKI